MLSQSHGASETKSLIQRGPENSPYCRIPELGDACQHGKAFLRGDDPSRSDEGERTTYETQPSDPWRRKWNDDLPV